MAGYFCPATSTCLLSGLQDTFCFWIKWSSIFEKSPSSLRRSASGSLVWIVIHGWERFLGEGVPTSLAGICNVSTPVQITVSQPEVFFSSPSRFWRRSNSQTGSLPSGKPLGNRCHLIPINLEWVSLQVSVLTTELQTDPKQNRIYNYTDGEKIFPIFFDPQGLIWLIQKSPGNSCVNRLPGDLFYCRCHWKIVS